LIVLWSVDTDQPNVHVESRRVSADLMLKFDDRLSSGKSAHVVMALELDGNLNRANNVNDEALDEFLGNYELLDTIAVELQLIFPFRSGRHVSHGETRHRFNETTDRSFCLTLSSCEPLGTRYHYTFPLGLLMSSRSRP
jgi:hypothetical protein